MSDVYGREPLNQAQPLVGHDTLTGDAGLLAALRGQAGGDAAAIEEALAPIGVLAGSAEAREHGMLANTYLPEVAQVDRFGARTDDIRFHPSWHWLLTQAKGFGLTGTPWAAGTSHAHLSRAAGYIAWTGVEPGHCCPVTMSYAVVPALRLDPALAAAYEPGLAATVYDPSPRPAGEKAGTLAGMGMTEKQGGSDVRSNITRARADGDGYLLNGHKWFVSAPMNDVFLVLAQAEGGLTCFAMPRYLPDGTRNRYDIVRLKDKLGNRSNASGEIEFRDAWAQRLGDEGRGVRTIIEMVNATRLDTILGSTGLMRRAVAEATWHASHRSAFGARLIDQPAMINVLADLALEAEAGAHLALRLARTVDAPDDPGEQALRRVGLPIGKFWVTKRAPGHVAEALEVLGGNGYIEESGLPLLYREAPVNSVWEGSGNVMALDLLRALARSPESLAAWRSEVLAADDADLRAGVEGVLSVLGEAQAGGGAEALARRVAARMAVLLQASLLLRHSTPQVADAFVASRVRGESDGVYGTLPPGLDLRSIAQRALPNL